MEMKKIDEGVSKILDSYLKRVPYHVKLDNDDIGFLILKSICQFNGGDIVNDQILYKDRIIGEQVNYRFDGHILQIAYMSTIHKKMISQSIRVE